ncbi:hypothetical protein CHUAL_007311 [Chamberlinius hualienensis]
MAERIIRNIPTSSSSNRKCCCLNVSFLTTNRGMFKLAEAILGGICQSLLVNYGSGVGYLLGNCYTVFLTNASACLLTTTLLLVSYLVSEPTLRAIRKSVFEIIFNVVAAWLYLGAASYLLVMTSLILWPLYIITPFFQAYPALTAASSFGIVLALVHAVDAYYAIKAYRGK